MTDVGPTPDAHVRVRREGRVLDLILARPEQGNLFSAAMGEALIAGLNGLDDGVTLVRLLAEGPDFCAGRDSPTPKAGTAMSAAQLHERVAAPALAVYAALKNARVPVLAVVAGRATGIGCALAAACDFTLAADSARFQVPELERDLPPTLVMSALMGRVPPKAIARLVLSRDTLDAHEALRAGLVSAVVPLAALQNETERLTALMSSCSPLSMRAVKQYLHIAPDLTEAGAQLLAGQLLATAMSSRFVGAQPS